MLKQYKYSILLFLIAFTWLALIIYVNKNKHRPIENDLRTSEIEIRVPDKSNNREGLQDGHEQESKEVGRNEVETYIYEQMGDFGVRLAICESGINPYAISPSGKYHGLFQYDRTTWDSNCTGDINDYKAQVECTKMLLERGEYNRWPNCP